MTNNNNLEDFEHQDLNHEEPPRTGIGANLAEAWRSKPLFKLMVVMIVVGALVAAGVSFLSGGETKSTAGFLRPPDLNEAPGGKSTEYMKQQTELASKERAQEAVKNNGSAIPTPLGANVEMSDLNGVDKRNEPMNELRAELADMNRQLKEVKAQPQQQQGGGQQQPEQFDDTLAQAMQKQMKDLVTIWTPSAEKQVEVTRIDQEKEEKTAEANAAAAQAAAMPKAKIIVPAGTVSYAQLLTEANSDVPGPILAQIVSGPFSGARAVGQFQVANGTADYLVLQFTLVNFKGKDYSISAIALDPDTTLGGMATEVNQRYFTRVVLPAAAAFLQGFGGALGTGGSSVTTNGETTIVSQSGQGLDQGAFRGLSQAAQTAGTFFQNQANQTRPLVKVAAGTPMGMFFITSVTDQQGQQGTLIGGVGGTGGYTPALPYGQGQTGLTQTSGGYPGMPMGGYGYGQQPQTSNLPYPNYAAPNNGGGYGQGTGMGGFSNYGGAGYPGSTYYTR